jgi:hypothetical protein
VSKFIVGASSEGIFQALHDAGVFVDDPSYVRRVVIDLRVNEAARFYVERFVDDSLVEVLLRGGIELVVKDRA